MLISTLKVISVLLIAGLASYGAAICAAEVHAVEAQETD